jgi:hypothetical protein
VTLGNIFSGAVFTGLALYVTWKPKSAPGPVPFTGEPELAAAVNR